MPHRKSHLDPLAMLLLLVLCASWGLQQVAVKLASVGISPFFQAGIRSLGAALLLLVWMWLRRVPILQRDGSGRWGVLAGLLFGSEFMLIFWGLEFTTASRAVIFLYLSPFVVAIGAHFFVAGERLRWLQVVGLVGAFAGILLVFGESIRLPSAEMLIGDSMLVLAALLWGSTTVVIKASVLRSLAPSKTLLYQLGVSAPLLLLASWGANEPGITRLTPLILGSLLFQTLWIAFVTYLAWFWLVRHYPAGRLTAFTFLTPLFGVLAGHLVLDEPLSPALLAALLLVGLGIYLVNRPPPKVLPGELAERQNSSG
ncbi:DMT family transporter [Sedimenticola thiotaurini]|uniref:Multidrug DMT transporter permease n=1 Tax=Sedimenticola thiotaurini TaxID=1543721 RepID=A0A0F7JWL0_9GAMM|nr:DMT family transporter [Sedimenticola thiotaurini]AKH19155.1 multidrug DMT transporter permease [Sedimenticola thiotaurini]